ncbi:hypothetical protein Rs2_28983 [Raphanus sativus]|nr:hypothetical protein Rs2_28983 [Raphanus sativus]
MALLPWLNSPIKAKSQRSSSVKHQIREFIYSSCRFKSRMMFKHRGGCLLRFREARNVQKGGQLTGLDMLLRQIVNKKYDQLMALASTNVNLADITGEVSSINTVFDDENQSIQRVMITIQLDRHNYAELIVCV